MPALLPSFSSGEDYDGFDHRFEIYFPAVAEICRRYGLPTGDLERVDDGSVPVFFLGADLVLKMSPPLWGPKIDAEAEVLLHLEGKLSVPTPRVVHRGELEGWRYFVMSRLQDRRLKEALPQMDRRQQDSVYVAMGQAVRQMHDLPEMPGDLPVPAWAEFVPAQKASCPGRQEGDGVPPALVEGIPEFLDRYIQDPPEERCRSLLHTELFDPVWFVEERGGDWRPSGLFDFGDAMLGDRRGDFPCRIFDARRMRSYLRGYGYADADMRDGLSCTMLAYFLLHRYATLTWLFKSQPQKLAAARSLEELAQVAYPCHGAASGPSGDAVS